MAWYSSDRERRLWFLMLTAVAAIYATVGLASVLADALNNQGLAAAVFLGSMFLICVCILTQGLNLRPGGIEIGVIIGIVVVYGFALFRITMPERSHLIEYSIVAILIYEALSERLNQGRRVPVPGLLAIGATSLIGALDEVIQIFVPGRVFDPVDITFNSFVAFGAVVAIAVLRWARRLRKRPE